MHRRVDVTLVVSPVEQKILASMRRGRASRPCRTSTTRCPRRPRSRSAKACFSSAASTIRRTWTRSSGTSRENVPLLRERLPGVKTTSWAATRRAVLRAGRPTTSIVGFVPMSTPCLHALLSVSPLRYGAGVKGKINLAMAVACRWWRPGPRSEGMFLEDGVEVLVADDPRAFADAVALAYNDRETWNRLSPAGLDNVRRHFSREVAREAIATTFAHSRKP